MGEETRIPESIGSVEDEGSEICSRKRDQGSS